MIVITEKKNCCGCTACYSVCPKQAITMQEDEEGFLYPKIDSVRCINCGKCDRICPIVNPKEEKEKEQDGYLVRHKDNQVIAQSTSGGAFTAFAESIIEKGGIVFGAAFDENLDVIHMGVDSKEELWRFRNSKYVQSKLGETFNHVLQELKKGRAVLFSGTPCQVEGLLAYLNGSYANLFTVDVVCHACPSPLIWSKYKEYRAKRKNGQKTLRYAAFRDKRDYGYEYSQMSIESDNGREHYGVETDPYLRAFFSNLSDRPSCYDCKFKKRYRESDVTIWDCFEIQKFDKGLDDNKGVTRVLVHSEKGDELMVGAMAFSSVKKMSSDKILGGG